MTLKYFYNVFPSHIGSRSTEKRIRRELVRQHCFHPTLVLAQRDDDDDLVSIFWKFPSHIGSRSTRNYFRGTINRHVSIPHWFSLNPQYLYGLIMALRFPSHIGSRSTRRDRDDTHLSDVSIPHWFSLNWAGSLCTLHICTCFHPTLVLAQHAEAFERAKDTYVFPSHIGSRSTGS